MPRRMLRGILLWTYVCSTWIQRPAAGRLLPQCSQSLFAALCARSPFARNCCGMSFVSCAPQWWSFPIVLPRHSDSQSVPDCRWRHCVCQCPRNISYDWFSVRCAGCGRNCRDGRWCMPFRGCQYSAQRFNKCYGGIYGWFCTCSRWKIQFICEWFDQSRLRHYDKS